MQTVFTCVRLDFNTPHRKAQMRGRVALVAMIAVGVLLVCALAAAVVHDRYTRTFSWSARPDPLGDAPPPALPKHSTCMTRFVIV